MSNGLAEAIAEAVTELSGTTHDSVDGTITWSRGEVPFAALGRDGVEVLLDGPIAAAARHTPDVGPSTRGADWVRFNPHILDAHALDRLHAWIELAHRFAAR